MNDDGKLSDDQRLIERVREAVRAHAAIGTLDTAVGREPSFSTATRALEILRRVELAVDPEHAAEKFVYADAAGAAYWTRPVTADDPKVVGILYRKDGGASVFFAIVHPP